MTQTHPAASRAAAILDGLGGVANVEQIDPCATRLRALVRDLALVDTDALKETGAFGVLVSGRIVQIVVGPDTDDLTAALAELM